MSLLCPKCTNTMRQYERNDVIIDQCEECGGLFLDRGELERLAQAEANYYNPQGAVGNAAAATAEAGRALLDAAGRALAQALAEIDQLPPDTLREQTAFN